MGGERRVGGNVGGGMDTAHCLTRGGTADGWGYTRRSHGEFRGDGDTGTVIVL